MAGCVEDAALCVRVLEDELELLGGCAGAMDDPDVRCSHEESVLAAAPGEEHGVLLAERGWDIRRENVCIDNGPHPSAGDRMIRPATTTLYAVWWDAGDGLGVLKVGIGNATRHERWTKRGAVLLALMPEAPREWERSIHRRLARRFLRAFDDARDARWMLGDGIGFTECFIVGAARRVEAIQLMAAAIAEGAES